MSINGLRWGGVERVFLNRAHAFQNNDVNVDYNVLFLHDSGGLVRFNNYIQRHGLDNVVKIVDNFKPNEYDIILSVDTPEILDLVTDCTKVYMECHTSYKANRTYLSKLPNDIGGVVVPSNFLKSEICKEVPLLLRDKIFELPNFVIDFEQTILKEKSEIYNKTPLFYLGRLDRLKNIEEILKIFSNYFNKFGDHFVLILAGPIIEHEINLMELLEKYKVINRVVYLSPVDFENVNKVFKMIKAQKGIFISASTSETYGLSVAEAIMSDIPVLLSYITAHAELVENNSAFIYKLGDIEEATEKLRNIYFNYSECNNELKKLKSKFSDYEFIKSWNHFMNYINKGQTYFDVEQVTLSQ